MDLGDVLAAVLKAGSLSGLAAFGWQLWNAYEARRGRLTIETKRYGEKSFTATVSYLPKMQHVGLEARAFVIHPSGAKVAGLERNAGGESLRNDIERAVLQLGATPRSGVKLRHNPQTDPDGVYRGDLFVTGMPEDVLAATLRVEIWTTGYSRKVAGRQFRLSPVD